MAKETKVYVPSTWQFRKKGGITLRKFHMSVFRRFSSQRAKRQKKKRERQKYAALHCEVGVAPSV
jgi:hypothetical protein